VPPAVEMLSALELLTHPLVVGVVVATACAALFHGYSEEEDERQKAKTVPYLPGGHPILGHALLMARNLDRFQDWLVETSVARNGEPFVLRQPGKNDWLFPARPQDFEQVLKVHFDTFVKGPQVRELLDDFMGENIVIINGPRWKFQRKALVSLFTARALREHMTPVVQKCALALQHVYANAAKTGDVLDVHHTMGRFTLETFAEIEFGAQLGLLASGEEHAFETAIDDANHISLERFAVPMWVWKLKRWLNVGSERRLKEDMEAISSFVTNCITGAMERRNLRRAAEARGEPVEPVPKDIVSILLEDEDNMKDDADADKGKKSEHVTPKEIFNISLAGVLAGKDTTGDATSWLMHMLHQNPRVETKLRAELLAKIPELAKDESYVPSIDELDAITYLEATIRESLRLKPPAPCVTQHCLQDTVFPDGTFVAKGTDTTLLYHASALLPSVWGPDAAEFSPERFLDEHDKLLVLPDFKFIAFSAGQRKCVGRKLAMIEMKIVTACLVSRFHLVEVPGQDIRGTMGISLGMKYGMKVNVQPIAARA
jgi:cytochrome P450